MQPIFDNIDYLFSLNGKKQNNAWEALVEQGLLKLEAMTYIRGRSIPNQFIIADEVQNMNKHDIKTLISRIGEGSKIILTGDPDQIDNPKLHAKNNGLTYVIEKFKDQAIAAHITLTEGERSELATLAAKIL
jgi:PhoH-like ATPase